MRTAAASSSGQIVLAGLPAGEYTVEVSAPGFNLVSQKLTLRARDRAVLSAEVRITQTIEVATVNVVKGFGRGGGGGGCEWPWAASPEACRAAWSGGVMAHGAAAVR